MLIRAGALTVRTALPVIEPDVAVMVVFPVAMPKASPAALTEATAGADEVQATELVMFDVLPSESVPVAVNCCDWPAGTDALAGVTAIDFSTGARTWRLALPLTLPDLALTETVPTELAVARPAVLIVATTELDVDQDTAPVRSFVLWSL